MGADIENWNGDEWPVFYNELCRYLLEDCEIRPQVVATDYIKKLILADIRTKAGFLEISEGVDVQELAGILEAKPVVARRILIAMAPKKATCKLHYRNSTEDIDVTSTTRTPESILDRVRDLFSLHVPALQLRVETKAGLVYRGEDQFRPGMSLFVENLQIGFSKISDEETALKLCGVGTKLRTNEKDMLELEQVDSQNEHAHLAIQTIGALLNVAPIAGGCEATRRMYIDPVLFAAANIVGDVVMKVERPLESAYVCGVVDYLFTNTHVLPL